MPDDFHCHTTFSDGVSTPDALIQAALDNQVRAMAITDHDNTESFPMAVAARDRLTAENGKTLELIPGIEINTHWKSLDVHVLGFFIRRDHPALKAMVDSHRQARLEQMKGMARLLQTKAKIDIDYEDILSCASCDGSVGRPHVAMALMKKGIVQTLPEAFQKYLVPQAPTYFNRETSPPHDAVEAIYESGGIPVIAHPGEMPGIEDLVVDLMDYGLRGLEAYHRSHSPAVIEFHCSLAEKYGLIVTGGTDYHGPADSYGTSLARLRMPATVYDLLHQEHERRGQFGFRVA